MAIAGFGSVLIVSISVIEMVLYGQRFQVVPEWGIALFAIPSLVLIFVGLLGFSQFLKTESRRWALAGALTAGIGLASLVIAVLVNVGLAALGEITFTGAESVPLLGVLLVGTVAMLLLSFVVNGVGSALLRSPSRTIGILLLVALVEPFFSIFLDILFTVEVPGGPLATLAIEGLALILVGILLQNHIEHPPTGAETH